MEYYPNSAEELVSKTNKSGFKSRVFHQVGEMVIADFTPRGDTLIKDYR